MKEKILVRRCIYTYRIGLKKETGSHQGGVMLEVPLPYCGGCLPVRAFS